MCYTDIFYHLAIYLAFKSARFILSDRVSWPSCWARTPLKWRAIPEATAPQTVLSLPPFTVSQFWFDGERLKLSFSCVGRGVSGSSQYSPPQCSSQLRRKANARFSWQRLCSGVSSVPRYSTLKCHLIPHRVCLHHLLVHNWCMGVSNICHFLQLIWNKNYFRKASILYHASC